MVAGVRQTLGSAVFADYVAGHRRPCGRRAARGRLGDDREDGHSRVRPALLHRDRYRAARPHPLGPDQVGGRIERRRRGRGRGGLAPAAQGSDGGGSIRIPSSVCGLFGIKPSRGRVSGGPLMPDLFGLGVDGPLARTVADAALLLDVMTGNHPGDMYTQPPLPTGETFLGYAGRQPGRLRIGRSLQHAVERRGRAPRLRGGL